MFLRRQMAFRTNTDLWTILLSTKALSAENTASALERV
jgi:hypothetical protein